MNQILRAGGYTTVIWGTFGSTLSRSKLDGPGTPHNFQVHWVSPGTTTSCKFPGALSGWSQMHQVHQPSFRYYRASIGIILATFAHLHFTGVHTRCDLVSHFPVNQLTTRYTRSTTKWKQYFFNSSNKYVKLKKETYDIDVVRFFWIAPPTQPIYQLSSKYVHPARPQNQTLTLHLL